MGKKIIMRKLSEVDAKPVSFDAVQQKINFDNLEQATEKHGKKPFILIISSAVVAVFAITLSILIPSFNKKQRAIIDPSKQLVELKDNSMLSLLSSLDFDAGAQSCPIEPLPLDQIWENYQEYQKTEEAKLCKYIYETDLSSGAFLNCYYLPKTTIEKMEKWNEEEKPINIYNWLDGSVTNYLRYFKELQEQKRLSLEDKVMVRTIDISFTDIEIDFHDYSLVSITKLIDISNKDFGNSFVCPIRFKNENGNAVLNNNDLNYFNTTEKYMFYEAPYLKNFYQDGFYDAGYIYSFGQRIDTENNTFKTAIYYNQTIIENDPHYYDDLNDVIVAKTFIRTDTLEYDDVKTGEHIKNIYDVYEVLCNYNRAKTLLNF